MAVLPPAPDDEQPQWQPGMLRLNLKGTPPDMAITAGFLRFGAFLRAQGLPATTGRMLELLRAVPWLDLHSYEEFFLASRCLLTERAEDIAVFDRAFLAFFDTPAVDEGTETTGAPQPTPRLVKSQPAAPSVQMASLDEDAEPDDQRVGETIRSDRERHQEETNIGQGEGSGLLSWTDEELLRRKDFGALTPEELRACRRLLAQMQWQVAQRRSRRLVHATKGRHIDWRRSYRRNIGYGAVLLELERQQTKVVKRPLVVIADVSGSMDRYTRPVLQLVHTMRAGHGRVEAFVFGTRLTRVTRHLQCRDPDASLRKMSEAVTDWAGGTRIGDSLGRFNRGWARRVLGRGSIVIIVSDGWDRGDPQKMTKSMASLQRRCHRLIWLNPALGGPTIRPVPLGMKAATPYIDDLMPARNLDDLAQVGRLLASIRGARPQRRSGRPPAEVVG